MNIPEPSHDQNDHRIKLVIVYQKSGPLVEWIKKVEKLQILTKGHNFVKIMTTHNLKLHGPSSDHSKTFCIISCQSNHESGMVGAESKSAWAVTQTKIVKSKF